MLEVDPKGNTKVVFRGENNTSFDWLIQSPDGHRGLLIVEIPMKTTFGWSIDFELLGSNLITFMKDILQSYSGPALNGVM